jgi:hypothetical protein
MNAASVDHVGKCACIPVGAEKIPRSAPGEGPSRTNIGSPGPGV